MGVFERCLLRSIYDSVNLNYPSEMKTGKRFIKSVMLGTIFVTFGGQKVKEHEMQDLPTSHSILYFGPWKLMNLLRENFYYSFMLNDK